MNIGIDVDGVLTDLENFKRDYGTKMCVEENWPINFNPDKYWEQEQFNWTEEQGIKFWNKYLVPYTTQTNSREFAVEIINKLRKQGHKIFIITARDEYGMPPEYYGKMEEITKKWLKEQKIEYDEIIFAPDKEKLQKCIDNNIGVMIEDSPSNILNISNKIKVIKYDCQYNKDVKGENIITGYSWYHIYDIINNL